jgi:hypothetical protein
LGFIDAVSGTGYTASAIKFATTHKNHFVMTLDLQKQTYSATVDGQSLGTGLAFRSAALQVGQLAVISELGFASVCNLQVLQTGGSNLVTQQGLQITITSIGTARIATLGWNPSSGAIGYRLYRAATAGGPYTVLGTTPTTTIQDAAIKSGDTWYYTVTAFDASNESPKSNEIKVVVP